MHAYRVRPEQPCAEHPDLVSIWRAEPVLHQTHDGIVAGGILSAITDCISCWCVTSHVHNRALEAAAAAGTSVAPKGNVTMTLNISVDFRKPTFMPIDPFEKSPGASSSLPPVKHTVQEGIVEPEFLSLLPASTLLLTSSVDLENSHKKKYHVKSAVHDLYQLGAEGALMLLEAVSATGLPKSSFSTRQQYDVALIEALVKRPDLFFGARGSTLGEGGQVPGGDDGGLPAVLARSVTVRTKGDFFHKADVAEHAQGYRMQVLHGSA